MRLSTVVYTRTCLNASSVSSSVIAGVVSDSECSADKINATHRSRRLSGMTCMPAGAPSAVPDRTAYSTALTTEASTVTVNDFFFAMVAPVVSWKVMSFIVSDVSIAIRSNITAHCWSSPLRVTDDWLTYFATHVLQRFEIVSGVFSCFLFHKWMFLSMYTSL